MSEPAIVMKWCETERQYMANFEDAETAQKALKAKKYTQSDDGVMWELRKEHKEVVADSTYETKDMTAAKKTATTDKKADVKAASK